MELVRQYRKQSAISVVSVRLPWFVRIALVVLTSIAIVVIGVIMASHRAVSDPFLAFNDLFGDDARQAALSRGFTCRDSSFSGLPLTSHCAQRDTDRIFSGIYMRMSGNVANEISFSLRENAPTLGDLVLLWGEPEIQQSCAVVVIFWPAHHIRGFAAPLPAGRISYFLPVQSVSFTRSGSPQWGRILINDAQHNCGNG
jgi:hypothetical protein